MKLTERTEFQIFQGLQDAGQTRHPKSWYLANRKACANLYKLDPVKDRVSITNIILRVLDAVNAP